MVEIQSYILQRKNNYNRAPVTQILKGNEKQFELARNSSYGVNFSEINIVKRREIQFKLARNLSYLRFYCIA